MDAFKKGWFSEINELWPGIAQSLDVEEVLFDGRSKYQHILVVQTKTYGRALILDGIIQCCERDEFAYQEMISFLPLCAHPNPESVLIVGGGDGGVAREVVKHPKVKKVVQVEIDDKVVEVSHKYLPFMAKGFDHPKVELHINDGLEFVKKFEDTFDVIITDSSDPVGPATCLFQQPYFVSLKKALKRDGIICCQAGTYWSNLDQIVETINHCKAVFPTVDYAVSSVPTYPTGQIGYLLASRDVSCNFKTPTTAFSQTLLDEMGMRYYSYEVHKASFALPRFVKKELETKGDP